MTDEYNPDSYLKGVRLWQSRSALGILRDLLNHGDELECRKSSNGIHIIKKDPRFFAGHF